MTPRNRTSGTAAEAGEGDDSPPGAAGPTPRRKKTEPRVTIDAGPHSTGSESVRGFPSLGDELRRWGLCRTLVHQFRIISRRVKPDPAPVKRKSKGGSWRSYARAAKRAPGLAAVKHAQQQSAAVPAGTATPTPVLPVDCDWPESMRRELFACRTAVDRLVWSQRWGEQLSGRPAEAKIAEAEAVSRANTVWRARVAPPRATFG